MGSEMAASLRRGGCRGLGPVGPSVMDTAEERAGRIPPPHLGGGFTPSSCLQGQINSRHFLIQACATDYLRHTPKIIVVFI